MQDLWIRSLVQNLWKCKFRGWQWGGFCKGIKLAHEGSVINEAFPSLFYSFGLAQNLGCKEDHIMNTNILGDLPAWL